MQYLQSVLDMLDVLEIALNLLCAPCADSNKPHEKCHASAVKHGCTCLFSSVRRQLRKSVCLALYKMWCDPELHYCMLEKACEDKDTTMAECLIELGADINTKTKAESLIYQVRVD